MSHFSTLGYTPNPLIEKYQQAFVDKLQNIWRVQIDEDVPSSDFLLFPDVHGLLLASQRPGELQRKYFCDSLRIMKQTYDVDGFLYKKEEVIPGTNILLTLDFINPDVDKSTHPDHKKQNVGISFGSIDPEEWRRLFSNAFEIVKKVSPGFMDEIDHIIKKIIPFGISSGSHNSGSYSDVIGHLLMSYPVDMPNPELALLEAILHEYNHNKLNLIMQTETLILSNKQEIYYSPYRPDARHIHGIYLGIHALAGAFWVILHAHVSGIISLSQAWQEKSVLYVLKNGLSLQVLDKYGEFSPLGKDILEEMRRVHMECLGFIKQAQISPSIIKRAKEALISHFNQVESNYPDLRS
ncbi:hypothetical protein K2X92_05685 [Candidatus Gracilibacteria bacterium]|nr:hypothetical protein [Candidatus Gracilibacteria bacterium]